MPSRKLSVLLTVVFSSCMLLTACDITFKRRSSAQSPQETSQQSGGKTGSSESASASSQVKPVVHPYSPEKDRNLISDFFNASGNQQILKDNYELTRTTEQLRKQLSISARLPAQIQILPLPLALESMLQPARGNMIRIQVENRIIMLDIKTRIIMDMFSLEIK